MDFSRNVIRINKELLYNTLNRELVSVSNVEEYKEELYHKGYLSSDVVNDIELYYDMVNSFRNNDNYLEFVIHTNYECNLACEYCYQNSIKDKESILTRDAADRIIEFIAYCQTKRKPMETTIVFIGGEPLLNIEIIEYMLKRFSSFIPNVCYSLITNGTLLDDTSVNLLKRYNFKCIQVTLDGSKLEHDNIRIYRGSGSGSYDIIIKNIEKYHSQLELCLNINLTKKNVPTIKNLLEELKKEK